MDQQRIGQFIKVLRKDKELTQQDLADKLNVTNRAVSKWENGLSLPDYSIIGELSKILDVSINELLSGEKINENERNRKFEENVVKTIKKNNKLKKFNYTFIIIVLLILSVLGYFGYKLYLFKILNIDELNRLHKETKITFVHENIENTVKGNTIMTDWDHDAQYQQKNISYYIPSKFKETKSIDDEAERNCDTYVKKDSKGERKGTIKVCGHYGAHINIDLDSEVISYEEIARLLKKYKINNIVDAIKFYENNYKVNIFTSSDKIKMIGIIYENTIGLYLADSLTVHTLSGGMYGYYISMDSNLDSDDKFYGSESIYVTNEKINNIVNINYEEENITKEEWNKQFNDFIHSIKFDEEVEFNYSEEE